MFPSIHKCSTLAVLVAVIAATQAARANEIYSPVLAPVAPGPIDGVPPVARVPGKEYTDALDVTHVPSPHAVQPTQIGMFDGIGGAQDGLRLSDYATNIGGFHIDAQSQVRDVLFEEARDNRVSLIVSTSFDQMLGGGIALAAERTTGAVQPFAASTQIVSHPHAGGQLRDVDSIDLWGPEGQPHAAFYSFRDDPNNTSIYTLQALAFGFLQPYLTRGEIAGAIGNTGLTPLIDVDALMVHDIGTGFTPFDGDFGPGDSIMFSIAPIPNPEGGDFYDGGEVWVWEHGQPAQFLNHGGHLWNTAFNVGAAFGVQTENIDALEAVGVPEPGTAALALCALSCQYIIRRATRKYASQYQA
jgi:hypothetical protein